ncbi:peptidyl-prolyl cis-trans isomerase-like 4 isoform X2 [Hetaerina americana]|uniref:peptidyl-prolyl cis-trans isomerase-like 4 isoform X2 n=1 Tax=Hetaerina americana TaxID=62018 RepID=UPI003A7F47A0
MAVVIETTMGCITVDLYINERPITCTNFLKLCKMKYYNFCLFHSVQNNFIAQTGDPTGTGNGGESIYSMVLGDDARYYQAEQMPKIKHSRAGLVSMVSCGNRMVGSQFFFTLGDELHSLDDEHCVFGEVTEGFDVLIQIKEVICDEAHHPFRDIRITHTVILEDPFNDPPNLIFPDRSPEPTREKLMNGRIAPDEEVDDTKGKTVEEVEEMMQKREAQARATILEIVGDIPDADVAPPENILFVCKLNPVTTDEDLEIIFGRFGKVKSCEVIRDKNTGDSLQYAFIEFEDKKACESAYFKMDNVLIDDRRIHVDFSQSVAKMRWKGKGKGVDYFPNNQEREGFREQDNNNPNKKAVSIRSMSRSPVRQERGHEESTAESWVKYQEKAVEIRRRHMTWEYNDGKPRDKAHLIDRNKGHDYNGQRSYERNKEDRSSEFNHIWDKRHSREGRDYYNGRGGGSERMMENLDTMKEWERRNQGRDRLKTILYEEEDRRRSSEKGHGGRNDRILKKNGHIYHGENSRYEERKFGGRSYRPKRDDRYHRSEMEVYRNEADLSSENEERGGRDRRRKRSEERERSGNGDGIRKRNGEIHSNYYDRSSKYNGEVTSGRGRDNLENKEKDQMCKNLLSNTVSGGSVKYNGGQGGKKRRSSGTSKKSSDKKVSRQIVSDGKKHSWSIVKMKKDQGGKVSSKKIQKRRRFSSSSSCCSDTSCSCGSTCFSSSNDSDLESKSDDSESVTSSSSLTEQRLNLKRKGNKKKPAVEAKKVKVSKNIHRKKRSSSSESSDSSFQHSKAKLKHRKRKVTNTSSSEPKSQSLSRGKHQKIKKRPKKKLRRKNDSSESTSEESSSSSDSIEFKKLNSLKRKKKLRKGVAVQKKNKQIKISRKARKADSTVSLKKKKKRKMESSESLSSSDVTESESSMEEQTHRKDNSIKSKGGELIRGR